MTDIYPIFVHLRDHPVLIVGGGSVALRKARGLLESGVRITLVAPQISPELSRLVPPLTLLGQPYASDLMLQTPRWRLVFATTDQPVVNALVQRDASAQGIFCCRCDEPNEGDFVGGAMLKRAAVTMAVNTEGASPLLAARIRDLAATLDPVLFEWSELLAAWRPEVLSRVLDHQVRRALLCRLAGPEMEQHLRQHGPAAARVLYAQWLNHALTASSSPTGARDAS